MGTGLINTCIYTYYGREGKPYFCGILNCANGKKQIVSLYAPGSATVSEVEKAKKSIKKFVIRLMADGGRIVISDFKLFLEAFDIPFYVERLNVYDLLLPELQTPATIDQARDKLQKLLLAMARIEPKEWQKATADAAVVYAAIEDRGLVVFDNPVYPRWSQRTYSGRTKTSIYNIQGAADGEQVRNPAGRYDDYFLHFDWRAADIRVAALLSGDERLLGACGYADPYQYVADFLNDGCKDGLTRDECKLALLTSINAMATGAHIFDAFPGLRRWIVECRQKLSAGEPLYSILGRKYVREEGRKDLSVFNATMQGTIAHAMQLVVRRIWEEFGLDLVAEIHDSVVVTCPRSNAVVKRTVDRVAEIMCHPFEAVLDSNPVFPVQVSVGNSWKTWKRLHVYS